MPTITISRDQARELDRRAVEDYGMASIMLMEYAIIRLGGKQYRVREGEYLIVDRVKTDEGGTFSPEVLLGEASFSSPVK